MSLLRRISRLSPLGRGVTRGGNSAHGFWDQFEPSNEPTGYPFGINPTKPLTDDDWMGIIFGAGSVIALLAYSFRDKPTIQDWAEAVVKARDEEAARAPAVGQSQS
eukprot:GILK01002357.1.p1 GENE.GILK01002357.1~~GILK01002357.1.p1  ORF type:complete len:121 (-),score=12.43 GILK01002357.1:91-408(-)